MAMRETVRSLRAYFILSGLAGLAWSANTLRISAQSTATIAVLLNLVSIGFSLAFLYIGIALPRLLQTSVNRIAAILYASAAWTGLMFLLSLLGGLAPFGVIVFLLTLLIVWYLLRNVRRLAADAHPPSAPAAPTATNTP